MRPDPDRISPLLRFGVAGPILVCGPIGNEGALSMASLTKDYNPEYLPERLRHNSEEIPTLHPTWAIALIDLGISALCPSGRAKRIEIEHLIPARVGDTLTLVSKEVSRDREKNEIRMRCEVITQTGETTARSEIALVL